MFSHILPKNFRMSPSPLVEFEFLVFEGFSNLVLASAMEPLRDVSRRALGIGLTWRVSTLDGAPKKSSSGVQLSPDRAFDASRSGRRLVLVAGYHFRRHVTPDLRAALQRAARGAEAVLALDTAPWLLAAAGLLDGHKATLHWQERDAFAEAFPKVEVSAARFVRSGPFVTCGGASTALDMMLDLIRAQFGAAAAFEASAMFVYNPDRQSAPPQGGEGLRGKGGRLLRAALDVMAEHIEAPLSTPQLAQRVSTSERTLNRIFAQNLHVTPGKYYRMFRLRRAHQLAQDSDLSLEQIALRCGFSSASSLCRSFKQEYGCSMRQMARAEF